ncbi:hypothetical protein D3C78_1995400 [compost metagenome]
MCSEMAWTRSGISLAISGENDRAVPVSFAVWAMMLWRSPACTVPTVTTAWCMGSTLRATML